MISVKAESLFNVPCTKTFFKSLEMIPGIAQQKSAKAQSHSTSRLWEALTPSLTEWILDAVSSIGLHRMTPVQASTIPLFLGNKDVVVEVHVELPSEHSLRS